MRVLFVEHDHVSPAGPVGDRFAERGFDIEELVVVPHEQRAAPGVEVDFPDPSAYDVVFLDPPYSLGTDQVVEDLRVLAERGWLAEDSLVVVERSSRSTPLTWPEGYEPGKVRSYGETSLAFARR